MIASWTCMPPTNSATLNITLPPSEPGGRPPSSASCSAVAGPKDSKLKTAVGSHVRFDQDITLSVAVRERARDFAQRFRYRAAITADRLWLESERPLAVDRDRVAVGGTRD